MPSPESTGHEDHGSNPNDSNSNEVERSHDHGPDRGPSDVFLDVPALHVDEIDLEVDDLEAHVSLQAEVLDLLKLNVGADVRLGHVKLDVEGVDVQAQLRVRLHNIAVVVTRLLTTVDRNPQVLEQLTRGMGTALEDIASGTGRAVGELGQGAGAAVSDVGRGAGAAAEAVGEETGAAVGSVGAAAGEVSRGGVESVGDAAVDTVSGEAVRSAPDEPEQEDEEDGRPPERRPHRVPGRRAKSSGAGHADTAEKSRSGARTKAGTTAAARRPAPTEKATARKRAAAKPAAKKTKSTAGRSGGKAARSTAGRPHRRA
ncbi:hypothetical protein ACFYY2_29980 [Streptomyces sp. NPDC001822]|uniref:hypothetical protein n=1 Tax=Streptomyces sp. NPDC001822 TaxID=3364614 RepID=UPI003679CE42